MQNRPASSIPSLLFPFFPIYSVLHSLGTVFSTNKGNKLPRTKDLKFNHDFPLTDDEDFLKLKPQQQKFIYLYYLKPISGWINAKIYRTAYNNPTVKYSTACVLADDKLKSVGISPLIRKIQKHRVEKLNITAERILAEESYIAFSDFGDLFDEQGISITNPKDMPQHVRRAIKSIEEIVVGVQTRYKVSFWSKSDALKRLQAVTGMVQPKKHVITGANGKAIEVNHTLTHRIDLSNLTITELEVLDKLITSHTEREQNENDL